MTTRAVQLGAAGAVLDGYVRDTREITSKTEFPTFCHGPYAQDQGVRGRVVDFRCSIRFSNGTVARPGDRVVGDIDGVLVVPSEHEDDILAAAIEKVRGENRVRVAIEGGISARQAYETYGIM